MIFDWFERRRLVRKGMACDKIRLRREAEGTSWSCYLEYCLYVRLAILALVTVLLHFVVAWGGPATAEQQLLAFIVFVSGLMLLDLDCPEIWKNNSRLLLALGATLGNILAIKALFICLPEQGDDIWKVYFLSPCTLAPFLLTLLLGLRIGLFSVVQVSILGTLLEHREFTFLLFSLLSGFTAVYFSQNVRKRFDLIRAGIAVGIVNLTCAIILGLVAGRTWENLGWQALYGIGAGIVTAMIVSAILPLLESIFQITTEISWIEQADLNHPLLQQMTIEAPGTYHHSLVVANIVEAGAKAIGLNGTRCRVLAYFHDIGKMIKPQYFTENIPPGANPHENLTPNMSALIIVAHVKEGVDLALKYRLKKSIIDAIQQHHGDSVVRYFYNRAIQQQEDAREGGKIMNMRENDVPEVQENSFRYPGPRPQSKEIALLAIADSIEAASRSLEKPTPQRIDDMVNLLVEQKIADHLLDESHLTLNELRAATEAMAQTVKSMMHSRIAYAKKEKSGDSTFIQSTKRGGDPAAAASAAA